MGLDCTVDSAGPTAGHDFVDNRVPGDGQRVRECLTERPELVNAIDSISVVRKDMLVRLRPKTPIF